MTLEEKKEIVLNEFKTLKEQWEGLRYAYIEWSNTKTFLGDCKKERKLITSYRIRVSLAFMEVNPIGVTIDTIRHECAHVLAFMEGDYDHGIIWKKWALLLGAIPNRNASNVISPKSKYTLYCTNKKCNMFNIPQKQHRLRYPFYVCGCCEKDITIQKNW